MNAILYNGRIYPQHPVRRRPTVIVISGNRIAEVGDDFAEIRSRYKSYRPIDLDSRVVIPGLVDSHTHFYFWAATLDTVHLEGTDTYDNALKVIKEFAGKRGPDEWIIGDGWSADRWREYHLPTAAELDNVTGRRPAALFSKDQHILWVNSRAMELAGIKKSTRDPNGGTIDRDPQTGEPIGILRETPAYFPVVRLLTQPDAAQIERSWKRAAETVRARGITGFHSVDGPEAWDYFHNLNDKNKLGFRVHYYFPVAMLDQLIEKGTKTGMGDNNLRVGGVKIFSDGSLGAQTALMKKPYQGSRGGYGVEVNSEAVLKKLVRKAVGGDLACAIHAIGDRAVTNVISAYEAAGSRPHLRHRIEHLQIISRGDIPRLKKTGAIASMQPSHCPDDRKLVALYWGARGRNAYIFRTLLREGIPLTFGSDCPIEPLDPWAGIHAAVNRTGYGERGGKFYPEECLTVAQAVYGFTAGPAYAAGREQYSGKILPDFQADLVILDNDIFSMPPSKLYQTRVAATIYDGRIVYNRGSVKALD